MPGKSSKKLGKQLTFKKSSKTKSFQAVGEQLSVSRLTDKFDKTPYEQRVFKAHNETEHFHVPQISFKENSKFLIIYSCLGFCEPKQSQEEIYD